MTALLRLSDEDFARARLLLARLAGLAFDDSRRESLAYSLAERMRAVGANDVSAYLDLAGAPGSAERQALLDEVTIQETHFFRNPPQMVALRNHVLPELVRAAAVRSRRLRIWSAGCSTGEEPYTVAMMLTELLPSMQGWDVEVLATDVSQRALAAARAGVYGRRAVQLATPDQIGRFFRRRDDGSYEVRPQVRSLVRFQHHNLATDRPPVAAGDRLDLVLCRNVTIYLSRDTTRALIGRLHDVLRDGGYLFLGHAETLWQVNDQFRLVSLGTPDAVAFGYRRVDAAGPAAGVPHRPRGPRRRWEALRSRADRHPPQPCAAPAGDGLEPARAAFAQGRYGAAVATAHDVLRACPLRADAHRLHGEALLALRRDGEASIALRKALYLDPDDGVAHFLLAGALARGGSAAAAAREYRAAAAVLARRPGDRAGDAIGGRPVGELIALCERLATQQERVAATQDVA